jgi:hypothetical protein
MGCGGNTALTLVTVDDTNAAAAVKVSGRAFVVGTNDLYGGVQVMRWNRSRFTRVVNYALDSIEFQAQSVPGGTGKLGVVVNGALFTTVNVINTDALPRFYTVSGMGTAIKTIEFWEDFQERLTGLDSGADGQVAGTYVLRVLLPIGSSIVQPKAAIGIAAFGDSHIDGVANAPVSWNGWCGQLRRVAHARGWLLGYVGAGSSTLCGDGPTAVQTAAMFHDLWVNMGSTDKRFLMMRRPNDYAYYGPGQSSSPTVYGQYIRDMFTALDGSDPGWTGIMTRIPQGTNWEPPNTNSGGFTRDDYWVSTVAAATAGGRSNVQTFDKTAFPSLSLATDFFEAPNGQVHMVQAGHDKVFTVARTWYGL